MSYKSWRPSSRRDRRRQGGSRRSRDRAASSGSDKVLFAIAGIFVLLILAVLILVAINTR